MNLEKIKTALTSEINPKINNNENQKLAAVLIIIYDNPPKILMTKKPTTMAQHGGEISFPGGKLTSSDYNLLETALRETKEETGLDISKKYVIVNYGFDSRSQRLKKWFLRKIHPSYKSAPSSLPMEEIIAEINSFEMVIRKISFVAYFFSGKILLFLEKKS